MWKRPQQIWIACALLGTMVAIGLGWLTVQVLELDYQERLSRLRAEQEQQVSLALWRMDSMAMPIIAAEAARPYFVYQPYLQDRTAGAKGSLELRLPSPLLKLPSEYVNLNFQFSPSGNVDSPQSPPQQDWEWAASNGVQLEQLSTNYRNTSVLANSLNYSVLLAQLPADLANSNHFSESSGSVPSEGVPSQPGITDESPGQNLASIPQQLASPYALPDEVLNPKLSLEQQQRKQFELPQFQQQSGDVESPPQQRRGSQPTQNDYASRSNRLQTVAQQAAVEQRNNIDANYMDASQQGQTVYEGVSRPLWVGDKLLLARRVEWEDCTMIQGCWLNWDKLQRDLLSDVSDVLPDASLLPITEVTDAPPARALASIPVSLQLPNIAAPYWEWTPTTLAISLSWGALLAAGVGLGYLVFGVTSLSERRAAFVSAVTHELRTPLTTFQLYTEMLASGMIVDTTRRQEYLETLHREAGRLGHLIDNVLAYARLERQPAPATREIVSSRELLHRMAGRLIARAEQGGMTITGLSNPNTNGLVDDDILSSEIAQEELVDVSVQVEPMVIEQILLNLVDNACKYASSANDRTIRFRCLESAGRVTIDIEDSGPGIAADVRQRLFRPFSKSDHEAARTAPGVGLGLALSRGLARQQGGELSLVQSSSQGTTFRLTLPRHA